MGYKLLELRFKGPYQQAARAASYLVRTREDSAARRNWLFTSFPLYSPLPGPKYQDPHLRMAPKTKMQERLR